MGRYGKKTELKSESLSHTRARATSLVHTGAHALTTSTVGLSLRLSKVITARMHEGQWVIGRPRISRKKGEKEKGKERCASEAERKIVEVGIEEKGMK